MPPPNCSIETQVVGEELTELLASAYGVVKAAHAKHTVSEITKATDLISILRIGCSRLELASDRLPNLEPIYGREVGVFRDVRQASANCALAIHLTDRGTSLGLTKSNRDLLFGEFRLLHGKTTSLFGVGFAESLDFWMAQTAGKVTYENFLASKLALAHIALQQTFNRWSR